MSTFIDFELAEKYLNQELGSLEMQAFEQRLSQEESTRSLIADMKMLSDGFGALRADVLQSKMQAWESSYSLDKMNIASMPKSKRYWFKQVSMFVLGVAASIFTVIFTLSFFPESKPANEVAYDKHFSLMKDLTNVRSVIPNEKRTSGYSIYTERKTVPHQVHLEKGMEFYSNDQFKSATISLNEFLKKNEVKSAVGPASLYLGVSYLEIGEYDLAESAFNDVIKVFDVRFVEDAYWYKALICLKRNDVVSTKSNLEKILNSDPSQNMKMKANLLLGELAEISSAR